MTKSVDTEHADPQSKPWYRQEAPALDKQILQQARDHQNTLTKPAGSLGELETIAVQFCAWQKTLKPSLETIGIRVFAGDHGVCDKGVSAFPQSVTTQMISNFVAGGAAISVLAKHLSANFAVVNMGTVTPPDSSEGVIDYTIAPGTKDFSEHNAMTPEQCEQALNAGKAQALNAAGQLFIGGEMGIGNTTSAAAIYASLLGVSASVAAGPGTGLSEAGIKHKAAVIQQALNRHRNSAGDPLSVLSTMGGFEIAALTGAYIACAQAGKPSLVDGFITTAAALCACAINPSVRNWLMFSHRSAEPAHILALEHLSARPLLDLGMRLGEGSGAALAASIITAALNLHNEMASFDTAGVSASDT